MRFLKDGGTVLAAVAGLSLAGLLAACGGTSSLQTAQVVSQDVAQDIQLFAGAAPNIVNSLSASGIKLDAGTLAKVQADAAAIKTTAASFASQSAISPNDPKLAQFEQAANDLIAVAASIPTPPMPADASLAITAAGIVVPMIETAVNQLVGQVQGQLAAPGAAAPDADKLAAARLELKAFAGK